ncbi:MAG: alpha/beta fold hydrolase [Pseudomonadota bacterium]
MLTTLAVGDNKLQLPGPSGQIETLINRPSQLKNAKFAAIICHPHPLHGGAMTNKVVHTVAKTIEEKGGISIRFNFRGVGRSDGTFAKGEGEIDDLYAVFQWLKTQLPNINIILAGFSFGAYVSAMAHNLMKPKLLISLAPPVKRFDFDNFERPSGYWQVIAAEKDELVELLEIEKWLQRTGKPDDYQVIQDSSHFFHGKLNILKDKIDDAISKAIS